jgi:(1->4)-alpha-D-glucan 1-alpha-D-glucosylmutase
VVVEKILEQGEQLPENWATDGTVGYEFGMLLTNLFIDGRNRRAFTNLYHRFIGGPLDPDSVVYESKHLILHTSLASEVAVLTHQLEEICSADRHARDFTRKMLSDGIREVIACFPVYRTYVDARGNVSDRDRAYINEAVSRAKRRNESTAHSAFDLIRDILLLKEARTAELGRKQLYFTMKFQQLTGPTMAKGLEDTACYIYNRLVSVNEVGGSPREFGITPEEFHKANQTRLANWPRQLLETSTHDSKRSEDVRARLNVLSEMPKEWSAHVMRWRRTNRTRKRIISDGRTVPDPNEEYLLYQTLVGAWPYQMETAEDEQQFLQRIQAYMSKAVHEAKVNLSWTNPNPEYVQAVEQFLAAILQSGKGKRANAFVPQLQALLPAVMFFGALNSLAQVLLKLTAPGVPDIYQGNEVFNFSLVDPDNRRPVDYQLRRQALADLLENQNSGDLPSLCHELLREYRDGRIKLWTTLRALHFRREHSELLSQGAYRVLTVTGSGSQHAVAFAREHETGFAVIVVPRFAYTLMKDAAGSEAPYGSDAWLQAWSEAWKDTQVQLPLASPARLKDVFTGEWQESEERSLHCGELFRHFPVALLSGE